MPPSLPDGRRASRAPVPSTAPVGQARYRDSVSGSSLAHWFHSISDDELARIVHARPDLATPPPADTGVLATRAGTAGSLARACEGLDTFALATLEGMLLLDADTAPITLAALSALMGADARPAVDAARGVALVWGGDEALSLVPAVREVLGPYPAGLGREVSALRGVSLDNELAGLSEAEHNVLATLSAGPPVGTSADASTDASLETARSPVQSLLARGLLIRRDPGTVELPRQVAIALRGGSVFSRASLSEPRPATTAHAVTTVDEAAASEALDLTRQLATLLELWSATPPPALKSGGIGVRHLRRFSRELDVSEGRTVLLAELASGAGLVAMSNATQPEWMLTTLADSWLGSPPAHRWALLATAWLDLPRLAFLAYRAGDEQSGSGNGSKDKQPAPLSDQLHKPSAIATRRAALDTLAELPEGTGIDNTEDLVSLLTWRAPRRGGAQRDELVRWTLTEAMALGVVALGTLSTPARTLIAAQQGEISSEYANESTGETADERRRMATAAMAEALPEPVDHFLVQADLTVVAPGPLQPGLATDLNAVADVESAGHATVYRVTEQSLRRALDSGRTAEELHELFESNSRTPVPQGLTYLIDDVARRHGRLRGGSCSSFLRCDDEVLLAEVLNSSAAGELELRAIAPTVLASQRPLTEVLDGLRCHGFAPSAEGIDGRVRNVSPDSQRTIARAPARHNDKQHPAEARSRQAADIVARIRAGDRAAASRRGSGVTNPAGTGDTSATLELLARASRQRREVWIGLVDSHGTASQRVLTPARVGGGVLEGEGSERYPLHRITSVAFVDP